MEIKRMTAVKTWIRDIIEGRFVRGESTGNYVLTPNGAMIGRVWITGWVVAKYDSEDGNFSSITLDDSTATIRAKTFGGARILEGINRGDIVDLIGKVKEYNNEIYISPESAVVVDTATEMLRTIERERARKSQESKRRKVLELMDKVADMEEMKRLAFENYGIDPHEVDSIVMTIEKDEDIPNDREMILKLIEESDHGDGANYTELLEKSGLGEARLDAIVNELLESGLCYEPRPGKIKRL